MYSEQPVEGLLGQSLECCWQHSGRIGAYGVPPDGCVDIVYSSTAGLSIVGAMTTERVFTMSAEARQAGLRFRPGMARALAGSSSRALSAAEFTDGVVPLENIWGRLAREAMRRLDDETSTAGCSVVLQSLVRPVETKSPVQRALEYAAQQHGMVSLDWIASQSNLSVRQFRRRCLEESGLTPKQLCRILRFRHARGLAVAARRPDWADIAALTGYCDQAHLVRDFRAFSGRTPMAVLSNR